MAEPHISVATKNDLASIARIFHQVGMIHYQNTKTEFKEPNLKNDLFFIGRHLRAENIQVIKAEIKGQICGYLILYINNYPDNYFICPARGFISSIGVDEQFRGQGIGKKLLAFAEQMLKEKGIKILEIDVYTFNKAADNLYNKAGFEDIKCYKRKIIG